MKNNPTPDYLSIKTKELFGLDYLFPYQRLVITNILEATEASSAEQDKNQSDRNTLGKQVVILPTGAGKSLCFQLPAMLLEGITLVIYPILSLMADQERRLHEKGFNPVILRGEQSKTERAKIWELLQSKQSRFIIANPEVLLTPQVKAELKNIDIKHIVIDEAHCVSEWGESFRPSYLEIGSIINDLNPPLVTAFTATASAPVLEKIKRYIFNNTDTHQIVGNPDRPNICYSAKSVISRNLAVRDLLIQNTRPAIVFCSSRPGTERLARYLGEELAEMGYPWHNEIRFYHAGLSREEKTAVEKWFINNPKAVLCATCAYGMGVDKADIRTVIHRDCAPTAEAYLQESGRAGRDGGQSMAILLWGPEDKKALEKCKTDNSRSRFLTLLNYAKDIDHCRRHSLLKMLNYEASGETWESPEKYCCDVCEGEAENKLREEIRVLNFIRKNKRRYTTSQAASAITSNEFRWSENEAKEVISYLLNQRKLKKHMCFLWKNKITL
ncbi:MAG: RecQ family ATP-dependent DNA helicase [Treponema sp.]|jgi:ATP-dependent DNA helicase RecQ|nr:RecQ family ATP-dependent DNA helicase [Treponema sp.]